MKKGILQYINKLEGFKTAIKSLHWNASSLPQHQLCDDIAEAIADHQDEISEVEQSISGKLPFNKLSGATYTVSSLPKFIEDVLTTTKSFYKNLNGDEYIGMRSDCESFLSQMQRKLYLANFTLKEEAKARMAESLNEGKEDGVEYVVDNGGNQTITLSEGELGTLVNFSIAKTILMREDVNSNARTKVRKVIQQFLEEYYGDDSRDYYDELPQFADDISEYVKSETGADMVCWGDYDKQDFEITVPAGHTTIKGYFYTVEDNCENIAVKYIGRGFA